MNDSTPAAGGLPQRQAAWLRTLPDQHARLALLGRQLQEPGGRLATLEALDLCARQLAEPAEALGLAALAAAARELRQALAQARAGRAPVASSAGALAALRRQLHHAIVAAATRKPAG